MAPRNRAVHAGGSRSREEGALVFVLATATIADADH
jgi:hypothetical protein